MIEAVIEIQPGSRFKYEITEAGTLCLDRVIDSIYPTHYGFIPNTLELDGDPLDIFIVSSETIPHLATVKIIIIGAFLCKDNGVQDNKLFVRVANDLNGSYSHIINHIDNTHNHIGSFLKTYKSNFEVIKYIGKEEASKLYEQAVLNFKEANK